MGIPANGDIIDVTATRLGLIEHHAMVVGKRWAQTVQELLQYQINPNLA